jgi:DNA repair protein RecN (Recombination protein N)
VREGANKADITAEFDTDAAAQQWLQEHEFASDEGNVLLRRVIDNAGRSKAYINGVAATATQLRELGEMLVDIHGQHAHQSLMKTDAQRVLLDNQAGLQEQVRQLQGLYKSWRAIAKQREEFEVNAKNVLLERERLEWQVTELEKLAVKPGEWAEISNEHSRLSHAASLIEGAQEALAVVSESDDPMLSRLSSLNQKISKLVAVDEGLKPVLEALEPARIQLQEAVYTLNDYLSRVELDPGRLREVELRMEAIHTASRKFRVPAEELPEELEKLSAQLKQLADASDMEGLRVQEAKAQAAYMAVAEKLSAARNNAAHSLGEAVTAAMQDLSMSGGRFAIALNTCEAAVYGVEQVEFMVAAHPGSALRPLAKVASGGELARISLAISVIASAATATPTLIFDEVDSGIGGGVAEVVGRLLKRLGQDRQVLCVTHLPQVASQGNQHFQVSKQLVGERTASRIAALDAKSRIEEVARMLGGIEITATTRKHARELLAS